MLTWPGGEVWIFEVKRSSAPAVSRGFYQADADVQATRKCLVAPVANAYPAREAVEVLPLWEAVRLVAGRASD